MADIKIEYDDDFGINTFKREIISRFGEDRWNIITEGIEVPDINREGSCGCRNMVVFMENFRNYIDEESGKEILTNVRHGLRPSQ